MKRTMEKETTHKVRRADNVFLIYVMIEIFISAYKITEKNKKTKSFETNFVLVTTKKPFSRSLIKKYRWNEA